MNYRKTTYNPLILIRRILVVLLFVIVIQKSYGQSEMKQYTFSQIGLTIQVPSDFELVKDTQVVEHIEHGKTVTNRKRIEELEKDEPKNLITVQKGELNSFAIIITLGDDDFYPDQMQNNFLIAFVTQCASVPIDTLSSKVNVDGIVFKKFYVSAKVNDTTTLSAIHYHAVYKNYLISIPIYYADSKIGEQLNAIITTSKFEK